MKNTYKLIFTLSFFILSQSIFTQNSISGYVLDEESMEELLFSTIAVYQEKKLITGAETNLDGYYKIDGLPDGEYELEFSYIGYETRKEKISLVAESGNALDRIHMLKGSFLLPEVVIIDGKQPMLTICGCSCTSTVTSVCDEDIENERNIYRSKKKGQAQEKEALIFPNPAHDVIRVRVTETVEYISISNITGKQLAFVRNTSQDLMSLPVSDLFSGTYYLTFIYKDGSMEAEKFIKVDF